MKKFIVLYHASAADVEKMSKATPEEQMEGMKPWMAWKESIGDQLIDFGAPLFGGTRLLPNGSTVESTKEVSGYSIIQAKNMDEAKLLLKDHPHLAWSGGCHIEIHECAEM